MASKPQASRPLASLAVGASGRRELPQPISPTARPPNHQRRIPGSSHVASNATSPEQKRDVRYRALERSGGPWSTRVMGAMHALVKGRLVWAISLSGAVACGSSVVVEGGAGGGGGASTSTGSTMSSSATGMPADCASLSDESGCLQANGCAPLYDWSEVIAGAPPPPPEPTPSSPCCPECLAPKCIDCHQGAFTYCVPVASQCNPTLPPDVCGYAADCP